MIEGTDDFREFADDVRDIDVDAAIKRGIKQTADDYVDALTEIIEAESTSKGGTFDSRTSPYKPGTKNSSSDDSYHISESEAWVTRMEGDETAVIHPRQEVADRARMMEFGTDDHGPDGETPMHFYLNGAHIVVADIPEDDTEALNEWFSADTYEEETRVLFNEGVPGEVEGVDANHFFLRAYQHLNQRKGEYDNWLNANIAEELEREAAEAMA